MYVRSFKSTTVAVFMERKCVNFPILKTCLFSFPLRRASRGFPSASATRTKIFTDYETKGPWIRAETWLKMAA